MNKIKIILVVFIVFIVISIIAIIGSIYLLIELTSYTQTFSDKCLEYHNDRRSEHFDTPPLVLSKELIKSSEFVAQELAKTSKTDSDDIIAVFEKNNSNNYKMGENIWSVSLRSSETEEQYTNLECKKVVKEWYKELKHYYYGVPFPALSKTRHFTQIAWKNTKELGCAKSYNKHHVYAVCHYRPKGNFRRQYQNNVMKRNGKFVFI